MSSAALSEHMVVLINPPGIKAVKSLGLHSPNPPVGLAYIAAVLKRQGTSCCVIDMAGEDLEQVTPYEGREGFYVQGLSIAEATARIPADADIVGISCMFSVHWPLVRELTRKIRDRLPQVFMVGGGEHITALPEFSLRDSSLDAVVMGEGETIFPSLLSAVRQKGDMRGVNGVAFRDPESGNILINDRQERIADLDSVPWPDWDAIPIEHYIAADLQNGVNRGRSMPVVATRGCPFRCTFCSNTSMWGCVYRTRDPEDVVAEMKHYREKYRAVNFNFQDLTAFVNKGWVLKLCDAMLREGLDVTWQLPSGTRVESFDEEVARSVFRAGCRNIAFAPESASPEILKSVKKNVDLGKMKSAIRAAVSSGINLSCFFVIGFPLESEQTLRMTLGYLRELARMGVSDIGLTQFVPYPGSELFRELLDRGEIEINDDYLLSPMDFYLRTNRIYTKNLLPRELYRWQIRLLLNFYLYSALYHPLKMALNILKAVFFRKEETRYAKFITDVLYRRIGMVLRGKTRRQ